MMVNWIWENTQLNKEYVGNTKNSKTFGSEPRCDLLLGSVLQVGRS